VLTLRELQADRLTAVADANWRLPEGTPRPALDNKLIDKIYAEELGGGERTPSVQRVSVLEISQVCFARRLSRLVCGSRMPRRSQYLELYLWPHFDVATSSVNHVLSILFMVNEKFREGVAGWKCFTDAEKFALFFKRCARCK
jgi:intron-binding protein aquarius